MSQALTENQRFPWLTEDGRQLLHHLMQHPHAPRFNHQCGDRLTASGLERVRAFERELRQPRKVWKADEVPVWLPSFAARCLAEVPFYRKRGGDPLDFLTLRTCDRGDLNREPWAFVPDSEPLEDLIVYETSGTTGHPIYILSHPEVSSKYLPALRYALARHGVILAGGPGRVAIVLICAQNLTFTYASVSAYLDGAGFIKLNLNPLDWNDPHDRARFLDECNPEIYSGDPFSFTQLAQLPLKTRPKALVCTAMTLLPGLKRELEEHFGCPVIDIYSLNESRLIAVGTEAGHEVVPHDLYVEILAPDGTPCPPGIRGEITVTGGRNPFLPLLRYRTGDHARLELRPDAVILKDLEGRPPVFFFDTAGRVINNIDISYILKPCALAQFSLHQAKDRALVFKTRDHAAHQAPVRQLLLKLFGTEQALTIMELIDSDCRNGKVVQYTSDLPPPDVKASAVAFQSMTWYEVMHPEKPS